MLVAPAWRPWLTTVLQDVNDPIMATPAVMQAAEYNEILTVAKGGLDKSEATEISELQGEYFTIRVATVSMRAVPHDAFEFSRDGCIFRGA